MKASPMTTTTIRPPGCLRSVAVRSTDCVSLEAGLPSPSAYFRMP
jgi:hypothetical protein